MSFASQFSICRQQDNATVTPTEEELELSRLERPGMNGGHHVKQVLNPGKFAFDPTGERPWRRVDDMALDVAERRKKVVRKPKLVRIENVLWHQSQELVWTAYLSTSARTISVPIDVADDAGLGYYNCRLLQPDDAISLAHRSILVDFAYRDEYFESYVLNVLGCSSIEQHEFAHVDTPLDSRSGHLLLGRIDQSAHALELTAFRVRKGDSVYIPAQTIHTNDYLLGVWETLLSSSCKFPSARVKRQGNKPLKFVYEGSPDEFETDALQAMTPS
jgi:hypothetical protein